MLKQVFLLTAAILISGCSSVRHAVPENLLNDTRVSGMQDIRAFSGIPSDAIKKDFIKLLEQEGKEAPFFNFQNPQTYHMLAISGGAGNGAYGAGLLSGWSQAGTRPVFKIVTGISTGAIIAPFVFLGSKYDDRLKEFYTKYSTKDVAQIRIPFVNSFASTRPLESLIGHYFDAALLKEIAAEYNKGRRLYVGTTNLDAERLVIWDMGKIAAIGDEQSLKLFRKIILASSSIPIVFPPVYLNVEADNKMYDEMHVDGGVSKQVFFLYDVLQGFNVALKEKGIDSSRNHYIIYVIRNGYVEPFYKEVSDNLSAITARTVEALTNAQSVGDLYQLYYFAKSSNGDFNLAYIPADYFLEFKELVDPIAMRRLFDLGFQEAKQGYNWKKAPPGLKR
ncbi:MAG: patatin-like phospholipase family protein [Candidatus Omnitrophica bacterium]|nr:patatin-like phospholipase family protein [Candidatus Omnitrophota bacterium]MDD5652929.1 patatin-like phospholipase family protein [Candidatus Omnitrophota bacterium]